MRFAFRWKIVALALVLTSMWGSRVQAQLLMQAQFVPGHTSGTLRHMGSDWVQDSMYKFLRSGAYGFEFAMGPNYGANGFAKWNDQLAVQLSGGHSWSPYRFDGPLCSDYLRWSGWMVGAGDNRLIGVLDDQLIVGTPAGQTFRGSYSGYVDLAIDSSNWIDIYGDEGTAVLRYGSSPSNLGIRLISFVNGVAVLGEVLVAPGGPESVSEVSVRAGGVTLRLSSSGDIGSTVAHFAVTGGVWREVARFPASTLGGQVVGIGDRRAVVRPHGGSGVIWITRIDGIAPSVESVVSIPGGAGDCLFAYARRGSLVISLRYGSETRNFYANREEPSARCMADLNGDDSVDGTDLGILLAAWGPCAN